MLAALGQGLKDEFPNPERVGCPGRAILAAIAAHRMPLSQAESYLDHLSSCSPCYHDFLQLQAEHRRRTRMIFAVAASVLIVIGLATWAILRPHGQQVARAVIDLRDRSMARGTEASPSEPPLEIPRNARSLEIYLPLGSSEGSYDVRISSSNGEALISISGDALVKAGITSLHVEANVSSLRTGLYVLQIRRAGSDWNSFSLRLR